MFSNARNWFIAAARFPRSIEANAALKVARNGWGFGTSEWTVVANLCTACAVVTTSIVKVFVADNVPSLTTNWMVWVPTGSTTADTTPVPRSVEG